MSYDRKQASAKRLLVFCLSMSLYGIVLHDKMRRRIRNITLKID